MKTKFNFNSQICTTREQSERLLALGLKKETADMFYAAIHIGPEIVGYQVSPIYNEYNFEIFPDDIPAWSLNRLIILIGYIACDWIFRNDDCYTNAINGIEWLIKEGHFNKEYLL